jgi:hypothetical protein
MELILIWLIVIVTVFLFVNCIMTSDMRDLGIGLIIMGLFFGWPWAAIGTILIIAYYYKERQK